MGLKQLGLQRLSAFTGDWMLQWGRNHWSYSNLSLLQETGHWDGIETIGATVAYCCYRGLDAGMGPKPLELQ